MIPGLGFCALGLWWGFSLRPADYTIDEWRGQWREVGLPEGRYRCWRKDSGGVLGQSQPFPFNHPRAISVLEGAQLGERELTIHGRWRIESPHGFRFELPLAGAPDEFLGVAANPVANDARCRIAIVRFSASASNELAARELTTDADGTFDLSLHIEKSRVVVASGDQLVCQAAIENPPAGRIRLTLNAGKVRIFGLQVSTNGR